MTDATHTYGEPPERGTHAEQERREEMPAVLNDPVPLGLVTYGIAALVTGTVVAGWWPNQRAEMALIAPLLLIVGGIAQFITAICCYAYRRSLAAVFFGTFGSLFAAAAFYAMAAPVAPVVGPAILVGPLGVGLACFGFIALVLAVSLTRVDAGFSLTSLLLAIALFLGAWALFAEGNAVLAVIGGWVGLVSGAVGLLSAAAISLGRRMPVRVPQTMRGATHSGRPQAT
jgi:succinate-acetate transporter protein